MKPKVIITKSRDYSSNRNNAFDYHVNVIIYGYLNTPYIKYNKETITSLKAARKFARDTINSI